MEYLSETDDFELTPGQRQAIYEITSKVPAIGLPGGGMGNGLRPQQAAHVLEIINHLGQTLGRCLRENEALRDEQRRHENDIKAFRRVIGIA